LVALLRSVSGDSNILGGVERASLPITRLRCRTCWQHRLPI